MGPRHPYGRKAAMKGAVMRRGMGSGVGGGMPSGAPSMGASHDLMPGETAPSSAPTMPMAGNGAGMMTPDQGMPSPGFKKGGRVRRK